jgi:hypothetical protein
MTYDQLYHDNFSVMMHPPVNNGVPDNYPTFQNCTAIANGAPINFFESVFDWDIMSYYFYPYFYSSRQRWLELYNLNSNDPLHTSFLKAGYAKVVVPVRPGFEIAASNFIDNGIVDFDGMAGITPETLSALTEIELNKEPDPITEPIRHQAWLASNLNPANWPTWEVRLPTNLVILQTEAFVPAGSASGLPENPNL